MKQKNTHFSKQKLELHKDQVNVLGPGLILDDCDVVSFCSGEELVVAGLAMRQGIFIQEEVLTNFHFEQAHFSGVKFLGSFVGCDFGDWDSIENSSIESCDFSDAELDGCRFLNCNVGDMLFPHWPCFVIANPGDALSYVISRKWPGKIGMLLRIYTDTDAQCVAVSGDAGRMAAKNGISLDEMRDLLESIPGIRISDASMQDRP